MLHLSYLYSTLTMMSSRYCLMCFYLFTFFTFVLATATSNNKPDLSKFRQTTDSDANLNLSLSLSTPEHSRVNELEKNEEYWGKVLDLRTRESKEFREKYPNINPTTAKQRSRQKSQKIYNTKVLTGSTKAKAQEIRAHRYQIKKKSLQKRIAEIGYVYGKQGELQYLKKKKQSEQGNMSKEESERLGKLINDDRIRQRKSKHTQNMKKHKAP